MGDGKPDKSTSRGFLIAAVSAAIGSGGGISLFFGSDIGQKITRPDPFTGSQAAALIVRIERLEREIENHTERHPDAALRNAIAILQAESAEAKAERAQIIRNQDRILDRLDAND